MSKIEATAGDIGEIVKRLGISQDTPVEIDIKLTDEEKIADLNALLEEAEQGEAVPLEPLKVRLQRLHARHKAA